MRRLLLVCASLFLLSAEPQNQQRFHISGRVVNAVSGEPVRGALVEFRGPESRTVMAGPDGGFEMDALAGSGAIVTAKRPGFSLEASPQRVVIGAGTGPITVRLVPLARISGRVVDREGEPIDGVTVQVLHQAIANGRRQWQAAGASTAEESGRFLMEDLEPGEYVLFSHQLTLYPGTRPKSEAARYIYPAAFYPDAADLESAQRLELAAGQEISVNLTLHSARAARVSFTTEPAYADVGGTLTKAGADMEATFAHSAEAGAFTFDAVAPGSWKLVARRFNQEELYGEWPLEVGAQDIENLKVPLNPLPDIPVLLAGGAASKVTVQLLSDSTANRAIPDQAGGLRFHSVTPGRYRVSVRLHSGGCLASVTSGSQDLLHDELVVAPGASVPPIQIQPAEDCPSLTVTPNVETNFSVVVTSDAKGFEPQMLAVSAQGFTFNSLSGGQYKVYAFTGATNLEYANPDVMRDFKSQTVQLERGQKASLRLEVNERNSP